MKITKRLLSIVAFSSMLSASVVTTGDINSNKYSDRGLVVLSSSKSSGVTKELLQINNPQKLLYWLESKMSFGSLLQPLNDNKLIYDLNGTKLYAEIDESRLKSGKDDSVVLYLAREDNSSSDIDIEKVFRLYVTVKDGYPVKGYFKDVNSSTIKTVNGKKIVDTLKWSGAGFECTPYKENEFRECDFRGGEFLLQESGSSEPGTFKISGIECKVKVKNRYIGTQNCKLPMVSIDIYGDSLQKSKVISGILKDLDIYNSVELKSKSIANGSRFNLKSLDFIVNDPVSGNVTITVSDLKLKGIGKNIPKEALAYADTILKSGRVSTPDNVDTANKLLKLLLSGGVEYGLNISLKSLYISNALKQDLSVVDIKDYSGDYKLVIGDTIFYQEKSGINRFDYNSTKPKLSINLKEPHYNLSIDGIKNILPEMLDIVNSLVKLDFAGKTDSKEAFLYQQKMMELPYKISQNGVHIAISPIEFKSLSIQDKNIKRDYGHIILNFDAKLSKNQLIPNNQMSAMMLLGYLNANSTIKMSQKDFESILTTLPKNVQPVVSMLAKKEGGDIIFYIEFKQGRLLVNGQPVM